MFSAQKVTVDKGGHNEMMKVMLVYKGVVYTSRNQLSLVALEQVLEQMLLANY